MGGGGSEWALLGAPTALKQPCGGPACKRLRTSVLNEPIFDLEEWEIEVEILWESWISAKNSVQLLI